MMNPGALIFLAVAIVGAVYAAMCISIWIIATRQRRQLDKLNEEYQRQLMNMTREVFYGPIEQKETPPTEPFG